MLHLFAVIRQVVIFEIEDAHALFVTSQNFRKNVVRGSAAEFESEGLVNGAKGAAMNGISYLSLDRELLGLMKEAGFTHLNLALVSSDTTVRETTKRPHTIEKYLEVVGEASKLGFHIVSYQILGLPNETLASMIQTLVFNARQPVLMGASLFYLTPRSPIARDFPEHTEEDVFKSRLTAMAIETDSFKREDLYTLFITTRIINFLKGLTVPSEMSSFEDAMAFAKAQGKRSQLGAEILETLLEEGQLYAATPQGRQPRKHFKASLFFEVWNQLESVVTQAGNRILISSTQSTPSDLSWR